MQIVVDELREVQAKYARSAAHGDHRRGRRDLQLEDLIADEDVAITVTNTGYIKRTPLDEYRNQAPRRQGTAWHDGREEDVVSHLFVASTHSYILIFSRPRQGLLAERARDPVGRSDAQGRGHRQPRGHGQVTGSRRCVAVRGFPSSRDSSTS